MIDKLVQLLNLSNVKKIIYVDDIFCVERYLEDAHAVLRTWLETDDYHKLDFISSDKDVLEEEFDSWWNGATDDDKRNCVFDVMQLSDEGQNILLCLNNIKNHEIKVECMSPAEFTDAFIGDLKNEVKDSFQVLFLWIKSSRTKNMEVKHYYRKWKILSICIADFFRANFLLTKKLMYGKN